MKKSEQDLKFIAMEARLEEAKKRLIPTEPSARRGKGKPAGGAAGGASGCVADVKWAWKNVIKAGEETKEKTFEGKVYVHCPYHGETKWVLKSSREGVEHLSGCRKNPANTAGQQPAAPAGTAPTQAQLTYARALTSIMLEDESNESATE